MTDPTHTRILVIDDNPAIHEDFRKILGQSAERNPLLNQAEAVIFGQNPATVVAEVFSIDSAMHGEEGVRMVQEACASGNPYALAFVDIRMPPGIDGVETALRLWEADPALQIVLCTAYSDYMWEDITQRLGRSDSMLILKKPFDKLEVVQMAHALTRKWLVTRQAAARLDEMQQQIDERAARLIETEEKFRHAQKMEAIGQLAAGVAHDFNNLLTVILGHASVLLLRTGMDHEIHESLHQIVTAAERAANLTRQLLAFSRKQVMELKAVDLNDLLAHLGKMLRRILGENIELHIEPAASLPAVHGDVCNLEQIIFNLVLNARDAMPHGGVITIRTALANIGTAEVARNPEAVPGPHVYLEVIDNGTGIDPANLPHIFEPFFTTKEPGVGTGMGLATVEGIVKQHKGWVEVESEMGRGSVFRVFLPLAGSKAELCGGQGDGELPDGKGFTVLVVEDEAPVRKLVRAILSRYGYTVLEAANSQEARRLWQEKQDEIDVLFTDMMVPGGVSGRDLAKEFLAQKPALRVIYTSGYSANTFGPDFVREAGAHYIAKPYQSGALASVLRSLFNAEPA